MRAGLLALALWTVPIVCLDAQRRETWSDPVVLEVGVWENTMRSAQQGGSAVGSTVGAVAGGAIGLIVGGAIGGAVRAGCDNFGCLEGVLIGAVVGEVLGVAMGAHAGNGGRGSLDLTIGASAAVAGLGIGALAAVQDEGAATMILSVAAIAQIVGSVAVQRSTRRTEPRPWWR